MAPLNACFQRPDVSYGSRIFFATLKLRYGERIRAERD
jgi:hypothetical protein